MNAGDLIGLGFAGYVAALLWFRVGKLRRDQEQGLERELLRRIDQGALPLGAEPVLVELERAELARSRGDRVHERAAVKAALALIRSQGESASAGWLYLRAHTELMHLADGPFGPFRALAWVLVLRNAIRRIGPAAALYLVRAHAQTLIGRNGAALDDLGRAVYYARGAPFYAALVLDSEVVGRNRPRLRSLIVEGSVARPPSER